jgi:hypothetical protein
LTRAEDDDLDRSAGEAGEAQQGRRRPSGGHGSVPDREDRREERLVPGRGGAGDGVDASVDRMPASGTDPPIDGDARATARSDLGEGDDAVLLLGKPRDGAVE